MRQVCNAYAAYVDHHAAGGRGEDRARPLPGPRAARDGGAAHAKPAPASAAALRPAARGRVLQRRRGRMAAPDAGRDGDALLEGRRLRAHRRVEDRPGALRRERAMKLFLDTGFFIAAINTGDARCAQARAIAARLQEREWSSVHTSDYVVAEALNFAQGRLHSKR